MNNLHTIFKNMCIKCNLGEDIVILKKSTFPENFYNYSMDVGHNRSYWDIPDAVANTVINTTIETSNLLINRAKQQTLSELRKISKRKKYYSQLSKKELNTIKKSGIAFLETGNIKKDIILFIHKIKKFEKYTEYLKTRQYFEIPAKQISKGNI